VGCEQAGDSTEDEARPGDVDYRCAGLPDKVCRGDAGRELPGYTALRNPMWKAALKISGRRIPETLQKVPAAID
jgi:hypothetical protein